MSAAPGTVRALRAEPGKALHQVRPSSAVIDRGILGSLRLSGSSTEGRLARTLEAGLCHHLGHEPSIPERLLVEQVIRLKLLLDKLGVKLMHGEFTDLDRRTFGAANNALRLTLQAIGLQPGGPKKLSPEAVLAAVYGQEEAFAEAVDPPADPPPDPPLHPDPAVARVLAEMEAADDDDA